LKWKTLFLLVTLLVVLFCGLIWLFVCPRDPLFHGKPESVWIRGIDYGVSLSTADDQAQIKQWVDFGPEGVRVLARALDKADHPIQRRYRQTYRQLSTRLPGALMRLLPAPPQDSTHGTRMCVISLLSRMGKDAMAATPTVSRALKDESPSVRQTAISFFTSPENENSLLNQMDKKEKRKLLPDFTHALEDNSNWGLRNNAALALRYYSEQRQIVAPVLVKALQDPVPLVRVVAAEALNRVDPDAAEKAGAIAVVIEVLKDPDDQVAYRAAEFLRDFQRQPELAVPALIESLQNTNTLVACTALWSLQQFKHHADTIIPALKKAAQREDIVGGWAKTALKPLESEADAKPVK
jgi:HEAT repeat protein